MEGHHIDLETLKSFADCAPILEPSDLQDVSGRGLFATGDLRPWAPQTVLRLEVGPGRARERGSGWVTMAILLGLSYSTVTVDEDG